MRWLDGRLFIRQTVYTLSVVVFLTAVIGSLEVVLAYRGERERLVSTMNQWFESVADTSARAAYHVDERQAAAVLDGLMKFKTVAFARITTDHDVVLAERVRKTEPVFVGAIAEWMFSDIASQQRALIFAPFSPTLPSDPQQGSDTVDSLVGAIELQASPQLVILDFLDRIRGLITALVLEFFLLAAVLAFIFYRTLTRPLLRYAEDLGRIDAQGTIMNRAVVPHGHERDELGLVVSRTNELLKRIFDLREAEELTKRDLEESERRFRSTFDNAAVGIVDLDENQIILRANNRMAEMLGYNIDSLVGMSLDSLVYSEDIDVDRELRMKLVSGEIPTYVVEKRFIRNDDSMMYGTITVSMVKELKNLHYKLIVIIQDITRNKEQEVKIAAQEEALIHREKIGALGSLLAGVAHELNNPLAIVMAQAELLAETAVDQQTRDRADKILRPAERCTRIVRTFLALARQREIKKANVVVGDLISDVRELLDYQFGLNDIEVTVDIAPDLPAIWGDSAQLGQALMNLLVNAQQALLEVSTHRTVHIRAALLDEHGLTITVGDNGPGIPQPIRDRIFEPFFTTKSESHGTGLGLSYCQSVAAIHDGTVHVEKTGAIGTEITLTLPIGVANPQTNVQQMREAITPGHSLRVLVVDDESELLDTMIEEVERLGFSAVGCANVVAALDALSAEEFDLVLTDIRMPGTDGPALYEEVCANKPNYRYRFIFVTGDSLNKRANDFIDRTKALCVRKPFEMKDLKMVLYEAIDRVGRNESEEPTADGESLEVGSVRNQL
ncbi:ATP-binding protein [Gammaproteobacteria bacterium]|nr:ATP-binding protein [Gammaproteobacteria bacterium]